MGARLVGMDLDHQHETGSILDIEILPMTC